MRAKVAGHASRPSLNDVAKRAGVSASTVSLVLAGKAKERYISDEVILRVQQAAVSLDYSPNILVRSMQRGRTNILSFFNCFRYDQSPQDLYTIGLFTAAAHAAGVHGCNLLLFCDYSPSPEQTYHTLNGGHSDGALIFAPRIDDPLLPYLRQSRLPVVLVNGSDEAGALSSVRDDVESGIRAVADRLVALGHRRIGILTALDAGNADARHRVALLMRYLERAGSPVAPKHVVAVTFDGAEIRETVKQIMALPDAPTVLFCWDDFVGYRVLESCKELGISVPERMSVIGYDDIAWPSRTLHRLASVRVDLTALADRAVDMLTKLVQGEEKAPVNYLLPVVVSDGTTLAAPFNAH
jgi:LacI family transcriptional regulator